MILTARRSLVQKMARHQTPQIEIFFLNISGKKKEGGGGRGLDSAFSLLFAIRGLSSSSSPPTLSFNTSQIYRTTVSCVSALEGKIITILS